MKSDVSRFPFNSNSTSVLVALPLQGRPAWFDGDQPVQARSLPADAQDSAPAGLLQRIQEARRSLQHTVPGKHSQQWVVSSFLLNTWLQTVPESIASLKELSTLVHSRAPFLFGPPPCGQTWAVSADWKSSGVMMCHAIPKAALENLENVRLSSLLTLAITALSILVKNDQTIHWYAITAADELHILAMRAGTPVALRSSRRRADASAEEQIAQTRELWHREQAKYDWQSGNLGWLHCDAKLPLHHISIQDIDWIEPAIFEKYAPALHNANNDAEQFLMIAWALSKIGNTK